MNLSAEQRRLLGAFLRTHRECLTPAEAGVHGGSTRRRTPGLRREEVAHLCGLSPTWYTWIEQGRDVSVSPDALARIADALHLTAAERGYLFELARKRDPDASISGAHSTLPPSLSSALETVTAPAYVLDGFWQACGWNEAASRLFAGWLLGPERNLLRYVFLDPTAKIFICDWENRARRVLAEFRADTARRTDDAELRTLVQELRQASALFAQLWDDYGILEREGGMRAFNHPQEGALCYEQLTLRPTGRSEYKLVMLLGPMKL
jgi:transcriptional regulator with XRE-family HTH domain